MSIKSASRNYIPEMQISQFERGGSNRKAQTSVERIRDSNSRKSMELNDLVKGRGSVSTLSSEKEGTYGSSLGYLNSETNFSRSEASLVTVSNISKLKFKDVYTTTDEERPTQRSKTRLSKISEIDETKSRQSKSRKNKDKSSKTRKEIAEKNINIEDGVRRDAFGNLILKGKNKKHKISFLDNIKKNKNLVTYVDVKSYKNADEYAGGGKERKNKNSKKFECRCIIF
jgi:hypothetical protein